MRNRLSAFALGLLLIPSLASAQQQESTDNLIVHGTINVALGNKNGIVVLTDSKLTSDGHPLSEPGQKLFKLDDRTVCSIAGLVSASGSIPDLNLSASAIIREYAKQSALQHPQSIAEKLRALTALFDLHLSAISNLQDSTGKPIRVDDYRVQIIVAGYDIDGRAKIGKVSVVTRKMANGSLISENDDPSVDVVEQTLVTRLNGMPDVASNLLLHPESHPDDPTLNRYAIQLHQDGGASLTVEQLVELAKRLAFYTAAAHPEVGGPNQIAIFRNSEAVRVEQQAFPNPPKSTIEFSLIVGSKLSATAFTLSIVPLRLTPGAHGVFIKNEWDNATQELDGNYFIGNTFAGAALVYHGGDVNFGPSNHVIDSMLFVGPLVDPMGATLQRLVKSFQWSRIQWYTPTQNFY
jgi:20S proteasome alpha/beta subunit